MKIFTANVGRCVAKRLLKEVHRVLKPAGLVSAYCPRLATHTDVESEIDIIEEFKAEGSTLESSFWADLRHNGNIGRGHILTFLGRNGRGGRAGSV